MAALVQTYPQQTGTVTMLQARPTANTGMMAPGQPQQNHQFVAGSSQAPRSPYHNTAGMTSTPVYRGATVPVQQYAFTSTPSLNPAMPWQHQQYATFRTNSSPAVPGIQTFDPNIAHRSRSQPMNQGYVYHMGIGQGGSRDDTAIVQARHIVPAPRPHSAAYLAASNMGPPAQSTSSKAAPERYRRPSGQTPQHGRSHSSTLPPTLGMVHGQNNSSPTLAARPTSLYAAGTSRTMDDMALHHQSSMDDIRRARQQSINSNTSSDKSAIHDRPRLDTANSQAAVSRDQDGKTLRVVPVHSRNHSSESVNSTRSSHSRPSSAANRNVPAPTGNPSLPGSDEIAGKLEQPRLISIPSRISSSDASTKRVLNPSPLSKPTAMNSGSADNGVSPTAPAVQAPTHNANLNSPAAQQLAAINQKGGKGKSKTSRLRRAFSFGSAADFRKAGDEEIDTADKTEPSRLHKDPTPEEAYDAEQARIAEAQEAAGIGNSIYGGRFFGSTDNLSISSTASSASIMIRKMGRGMKKSTRSLVGLFRPKSVIGVPAAEALAPEASQATVSMITVEAETRRVNVSADPQTSTSFPHLERNSMDASQVPEMVQETSDGANGDNAAGRKSIHGGDKERAEVLAAVRKGILKRSTSPNKRVAEGSPDLVLPPIPCVSDSPISSAPSTPNDDAQGGHRRAGSIAIGNEDYFMSALRLRQDSKSAPGTPQGGAIKRNATFSPRIVFHDTWPSQEYDRRGEVATCNRLTPMLAQQIKEELNSFKMEMEVHENSKIYTHFF
jgi:hypothetical protein